QFVIQVPPDLPTIQARRLLLQRVLANLIGNAIKHSDRPDGVISVSFHEQAAQYEFGVADNGPGIAAEYHGRIFKIFETLKSRDRAENTGIGLSLVKKIVEMEGGEIWVESELGQGALFRFTWPKQLPAVD
ncbi:MAG: sensor histidine kinase, partial [Cyanobacteria bacterium P01_A01_bin.135]